MKKASVFECNGKVAIRHLLGPDKFTTRCGKVSTDPKIHSEHDLAKEKQCLKCRRANER